jgi:hypothetical protein
MEDHGAAAVVMFSHSRSSCTTTPRPSCI